MLVQECQLSKALSRLHSPDDLAKTGLQVQPLQQAALPESALVRMGLWGMTSILLPIVGCFGQLNTFSMSIYIPCDLQLSRLDLCAVHKQCSKDGLCFF